MEQSDEHKESLSGGLRFIALSCWLTVILCPLEIILGVYDKVSDVLQILLAGLALYVALGIQARSNPARLTSIVLLSSGAVSMLLLPIIRIAQSEGFENKAELLAFFLLYIVAPMLSLLVYWSLLKEVRAEKTRTQFIPSLGDKRSLADELVKERIAVWIGLFLGAIGLVFYLYGS